VPQDFAFGVLALNRVQASYLPRNPASGRVLEKLGMSREGLHRERYRKGDQFEDVIEFAARLGKDHRGVDLIYDPLPFVPRAQPFPANCREHACQLVVFAVKLPRCGGTVGFR
jgi:hypothetical protein